MFILFMRYCVMSPQQREYETFTLKSLSGLFIPIRFGSTFEHSKIGSGSGAYCLFSDVINAITIYLQYSIMKYLVSRTFLCFHMSKVAIRTFTKSTGEIRTVDASEVTTTVKHVQENLVNALVFVKFIGKMLSKQNFDNRHGGCHLEF